MLLARLYTVTPREETEQSCRFHVYNLNLSDSRKYIPFKKHQAQIPVGTPQSRSPCKMCLEGSEFRCFSNLRHFFKGGVQVFFTQFGQFPMLR